MTSHQYMNFYTKPNGLLRFVGCLLLHCRFWFPVSASLENSFFAVELLWNGTSPIQSTPSTVLLDLPHPSIIFQSESSRLLTISSGWNRALFTFCLPHVIQHLAYVSIISKRFLRLFFICFEFSFTKLHFFNSRKTKLSWTPFLHLFL